MRRNWWSYRLYTAQQVDMSRMMLEALNCCSRTADETTTRVRCWYSVKPTLMMLMMIDDDETDLKHHDKWNSRHFKMSVFVCLLCSLRSETFPLRCGLMRQCRHVASWHSVFSLYVLQYTLWQILSVLHICDQISYLLTIWTFVHLFCFNKLSTP